MDFFVPFFDGFVRIYVVTFTTNGYSQMCILKQWFAAYDCDI